MSWWASFANRQAFDANSPSSGTVPAHGEGLDQYDVARKAAQSVIDSGAAGAVGKDFSVSLSGHSNARHEPKAGYANDCVTINISQLAPTDG